MARCRRTYAKANRPSSRRSDICQAMPETRLSGERVRRTRRMRRAQSPSQFVMKLIGLAVRSPRHVQNARKASGSRQSNHTAALRLRWARRVTASIELAQVHARVERGHLVGVAVEHERLAAAELADAPLGGLAPARVIDRRIDVGVEAVLARLGLVPGGIVLLAHKAGAHCRIRTHGAVFPRARQWQGEASLISRE